MLAEVQRLALRGMGLKECLVRLIAFGGRR
jgi:hypothetical protein